MREKGGALPPQPTVPRDKIRDNRTKPKGNNDKVESFNNNKTKIISNKNKDFETRIEELERAAKISVDRSESDASFDSLIKRLENLEKHSVQSQNEHEQRRHNDIPKKKKPKYVPFNMNEIFTKQKYTRFYIIKIDHEKKNQ